MSIHRTMTTFDIHIEFINGQTTWHTITAPNALVAEHAVSNQYPNVWAVVAHEHGARPGFKRQGRVVGSTQDWNA